jgi:hypothetical protein
VVDEDLLRCPLLVRLALDGSEFEEGVGDGFEGGSTCVAVGT